MKKYAGFLALAAIATLPACSAFHQGGGDQYDEYQGSQYPTQNESETYNNAPHDNAMGNDQMNGMREGQRCEHKDHNGWARWNEDRIDQMADRFFEKADANHDGSISWKEFERFMHKKFEEADTNHDRKLSRDEVKTMLKHHMHRIHEEMDQEKQGGMNSGDMDNDNDKDNMGDNDNLQPQQ